MFPALLEITLKWQPETFVPSLLILVQGMLGIFAVIVAIWLFVALLNRLTKKKGA